MKIDKGQHDGKPITMLYTFEELHKMCFPKEHRRHELQTLAMTAYKKGYVKAGRLLSKVAERYYSCKSN